MDMFFLEDGALMRRHIIEHAVKKRGKNRLAAQGMSEWELLKSCLPPGAIVRLESMMTCD